METAYSMTAATPRRPFGQYSERNVFRLCQVLSLHQQDGLTHFLTGETRLNSPMRGRLTWTIRRKVGRGQRRYSVTRGNEM